MHFQKTGIEFSISSSYTRHTDAGWIFRNWFPTILYSLTMEWKGLGVFCGLKRFPPLFLSFPIEQTGLWWQHGLTPVSKTNLEISANSGNFQKWLIYLIAQLCQCEKKSSFWRSRLAEKILILWELLLQMCNPFIRSLTVLRKSIQRLCFYLWLT